MGSGADVRGLTPRRPTKYLHHAVHDFLNKLYLCIMKKTHPERAVLMGSGVSMSLQSDHFFLIIKIFPLFFICYGEYRLILTTITFIPPNQT